MWPDKRKHEAKDNSFESITCFLSMLYFIVLGKSFLAVKYTMCFYNTHTLILARQIFQCIRFDASVLLQSCSSIRNNFCRFTQLLYSFFWATTNVGLCANATIVRCQFVLAEQHNNVPLDYCINYLILLPLAASCLLLSNREAQKWHTFP